jgi:hypothetical protein
MSVSSRRFPFVSLWLLLPVLFLWIGSTAWLVVRFRVLDSDSIMYGLPMAFAKGPFSLAIPFLGDFPPYSTVWGHQWPGAMWLRGALYAVVPFERWLDVFLLLSCQFAAAFLAGRLVWRLTGSGLAAMACALIVCSDRVVIAGLQLHRWEAVTILALVALLLALIRTAGRRRKEDRRSEMEDGIREGTSKIQNSKFKIAPSGWLVVSFFSAFVVACTHPFGMVIGAGLIGLGGIDWLILRRRSLAAAWVPAVGFLCGLGAVLLYYGLIPEAREQFLNNLALQNSFNAGSRWGFFTTHLRYYHWLGYPLFGAWVLAAPWVFLRLRCAKSAGEAFAAWVLPLAAVATPLIFILTRSANNSYATLGTPFAAILLATAVGLLPESSRMLRVAARVALAALALGFLTVYPYRWLVFFRSGCPDFPAELGALVGRVPPGVRIYIPPPLWDVARKDASRDYRLYTLSVASPRERRLAYERMVYGEAKAGDMLVVDRLSGSTTGDPWGILPTFEALPPDSRYWKPVLESVRRIPGAGNDFGFDLAVYEFRGVPWDPGTTPRAMFGR